MSLLDRFGDVVKSEWNARFSEDDPNAPKEELFEARADSTPPSAVRTARRAPDVASARRILEVSATATLDEVRAQYRQLARRYHPRTLSPRHETAFAAQTLIDSLLEALEVLEESLLPLSDGASDTRG